MKPTYSIFPDINCYLDMAKYTLFYSKHFHIQDSRNSHRLARPGHWLQRTTDDAGPEIESAYFNMQTGQDVAMELNVTTGELSGGVVWHG
jgi:hypothetical protein